MLTGPGRAAAADSPNPCAPAPVTRGLHASMERLGTIALHYFFGLAGSPITFAECVGERAIPLGERAGTGEITDFPAATLWRCGRLVRRFAAVQAQPNGSFDRGATSVRTRSCADRFALELPRRVATGREVRIRIVDRWGIAGVRTKLCVARPGGRLRCRAVVFVSAATATRRVRASVRGRWRIELRVARERVRAELAVGVRSAAPRAPREVVLATGDSTMDGLVGVLADELGASARVVGDVRLGYAISSQGGLAAIAEDQVARLRPRTTVVSVGANEGWPMRAAADGVTYPCCQQQWIDELVRRVRDAMRVYARRGRVFWLTLPAPRFPERVQTFAAANAAILRAAPGVPAVRVLRMDTLFTPNGFSEFIRYRGRDVRVRAIDGIHLNLAGNEIAARELARAMREG